jgi:hypothetical protein
MRERPMRRDTFGNALRRAVRNTKFRQFRGGLWHSYRRSRATARKHLSVVDVAAAGGWKDPGTLIRYYQHPTNDALLAVMSEPRKVHENNSIARNG